MDMEIIDALLQLKEVEVWLERCVDIAEKAGLLHYLNKAQKVKEIFQQYNRKIASLLETEKLLSPQEQEQQLLVYIKEALAVMDEEGLS